ncbi:MULTISPECIES: DUF2971 domain-containing protein [Sphingomonadales]|jgi:hypothetical protein|uniref:DUF2971 family protein n=2 Tax=Sphingomonadaceae TaxID=41297 RepID=A0A397PJQ2_9SPHN|nr:MULTISPECIES: DUF2971 domain-containing protein [Sphingomonadaceae]EKU73441.1 hypothetical protein HMPREF9718_03910 [Sphingobium yanoikuyae ATCC 51230]RIA45931.1 hypothetical protein DFR49_0460 [Hephaestia caeni]WQE08223.1 DUF2971 domain-containing protein [Sphingobium yanoikuyae]
MRLYHFVPAEHGISNIERRRLKIATFDQLNDPFELLAVASRTADERAAFRHAKAQMAERAGLLCFSRKWHNPVQWSHYAGKHSGLCLGFDVADDIVKPVQYQAKRVPFDPAILDDEEKGLAFMLELSCIKFTHWKYEDEVRAFVGLEDMDRESGKYFAEFSPKLALREVIVGAACTVTRVELARALGDLAGEVRQRKARLAFRSFRVVTQQKKDYWS